jgi:hypothetical protein
MLKSLSHFHQAISVEEHRAILRAMSTELSGTGHWYRCRNGHPVGPTFEIILTNSLVQCWRVRRSDASDNMPRVWGACWGRASQTSRRGHYSQRF